MVTTEKIKYHLASSFIIGFDVKETEANNFHLAPSGADGCLFQLNISYTDVRLKIYGEPQKYAANFVRIISQSDINRRKCFCSIWNEIGVKNLIVKIDEKRVSPKEFLYAGNDWQKFLISLNKAPYHIDETESPDENILAYIKLCCDLFLTLFPYEVQGEDSEGFESKVVVSKYERHPHNRDLCLRLHGYKCAVCQFDFEQTYGYIGHKFIEVHHINPVSKLGSKVNFDPTKDLVPLCSNCHSMAHKRKDIPYSIEELKQFIANNNK